LIGRQEAGVNQSPPRAAIDLQALRRHLPFDWRFDEPLSQHTTYRIGGSAEAMLIPRSVREVQQTVRYCSAEGIDWRVIGLGSNLLARDEGVAGVIIAVKEHLSEMRVDGRQVTCGAGQSLGALARAAADRDLAGLECLSEIPGTVGGAVFMNAGAYGQCIADTFVEALVLRPDGELVRMVASDLKLSYRWSILQVEPGVVLEARLALCSGRREALWAVMREKAAIRAARFPLGWPNAGSVFKRPAQGHPGAWIEQAGLKGARRGNAEISTLHANFIINRGRATAHEGMELMELARQTVNDRFGVILEREQRII
jgi:UDP-N-acetylmuramate dehydrogenase